MWGIIPAAGTGTRIQPLAFSKELLPVGSRVDGAGERPKAVSEYLVERMLLAGVTKICLVISRPKADIVRYYGGRVGSADVCYAVQEGAGGLCDAIFRALPFVGEDEEAIVGLPDTVWFPRDALGALSPHRFSFLLFPVDRPELFDAVVTEPDGRVREVQVKTARAQTRWVWGALRIPGTALRSLHALWLSRTPRDEYLGTLVNAWIALGGEACGVKAGRSYMDVGTVNGYRDAIRQLSGSEGEP